MTDSSETDFDAKTQRGGKKSSRILAFFADHRLALALLLLIVFLSYLFALAQTPVYGDPTEYTFVAHILGIAHPPGYAFITLLGKLIQTVIPFGTVAWRMHLLAAVAGTLACLFVFGTVHTAIRKLELTGLRNLSTLSVIAALFAGLSVGTAVNHWQHSIHANPHIITAAFLLANLYFLTKWWASNDKTNEHSSYRWLYTFCLSAGLGITHHPLTVFGFVGYGLFILWVRPSILRDWKTLLKMLAFAL